MARCSYGPKIQHSRRTPHPVSADRRRAPRRHSFAVGAAELAAALVALGAPTADLARKAVDDELTLRLPTAGDGPLASPELTRPRNAAEPRGEDHPSGSTRPSMAAWRIPVLMFEPDAAAGLLTALAGAQSAEITSGGSIGYLCAVALFAADLATRGRVLPMLVPEEDGYAARWRPVLAATDAQRARELASAMPPLCRAAEIPRPGPRSGRLSDSFAGFDGPLPVAAPLLPARRGRRPARIDLTERTVAALTTSDIRNGGNVAGCCDRGAGTRRITGRLTTRHTNPGRPGPGACFRLVVENT